MRLERSGVSEWEGKGDGGGGRGRVEQIPRVPWATTGTLLFTQKEMGATQEGSDLT